jgi:hypothetical protein
LKGISPSNLISGICVSLTIIRQPRENGVRNDEAGVFGGDTAFSRDFLVDLQTADRGLNGHESDLPQERAFSRHAAISPVFRDLTLPLELSENWKSHR